MYMVHKGYGSHTYKLRSKAVPNTRRQQSSIPKRDSRFC